MEPTIPTPTHKPCSVYRKCNGCQLQNMDYPQQLKWKQGKVKKLFGSFCSIAPIIGMENPLHYRNKVQSVFRMTKQKRLISGIYQSERQGIVAVDKCMTEDSDASKIVVTIRQIMEKYHIKPYDSRTDTGFLKHVLIRKGKATGQIMVVLVASTMIFPSQGKFLNRLLAAHPQITTVVLNENPHPTKLLLGKQEKVLYGDGVIYDTLCGYRFKISPRSFYQINHDQTERLYEKAIELAELTGTERIVDAYCGIGTIGLIASRHCKEVIAVESNRQAVQDAKENSKLNGVTNCSFYTADAGEFMVELAEQGERVDVVFMDPPRAGSDRNFLSSLVKLVCIKVTVPFLRHPFSYKSVLRINAAKRGSVCRDREPKADRRDRPSPYRLPPPSAHFSETMLSPRPRTFPPPWRHECPRANPRTPRIFREALPHRRQSSKKYRERA